MTITFRELHGSGGAACYLSTNNPNTEEKTHGITKHDMKLSSSIYYNYSNSRTHKNGRTFQYCPSADWQKHIIREPCVESQQRYRFQDNVENCFIMQVRIYHENILMYCYQKVNFTVHQRGKLVNHWLYW